MNDLPKVSCLCITRNSPELLRRSILCFQSQTYQNKELVIVYEHSGRAAVQSVFIESESPIRLVEAPIDRKLTLGELRNLAITESAGEYFCQWDDDDWYASNRIKVQMDALLLSHKSACMLLYWIMFDAINRVAYLSPFRLWEGSILCRKDAISDRCNYAALPRGEDTVMLEGLLATRGVYPLINPMLYIYIFHGNNTWDRDHFNIFYERSLKLSKTASQTVADIIDGKHSVDEGTNLLNSPPFVTELDFRFEMIDRYSGRLI